MPFSQSKWLINVKPKDDELLSSWLIRSALENGVEPIGWTTNIWGKWRVWTIDIDRYCPPNKIKKLSIDSGLSEQQLESLTLKPDLKKITPINRLKYKNCWPWLIPTGRRNRTSTNGLHYCPICLNSQAMYLKKTWRLAWNVACPLHEVFLTIFCPSCNYPFSPHLITYKQPSLVICSCCSYNLSDTPTQNVDGEVIEFQEILNNSLSTGKLKNGIFPIIENIEDLFAITLHFMKFFYSIRRYKTINNHLINFLNLRLEYKECSLVDQTNLEALPVNNRYILLLMAARLLKLPQVTIVSFLQKSGVTQQKFNTHPLTPPAIKKISLKLDGKEHKKKRTIVSRKVIVPSTMEEVERRMDLIRPFL